MERITLPTKIGFTALRVKKIKRDGAVLTALDSEQEFTLPLDLLPENIEEGERLNLKISDTTNTEEGHAEFARKLLEEIIN